MTGLILALGLMKDGTTHFIEQKMNLSVTKRSDMMPRMELHPDIDWNSLTFRLTPTKIMYVAKTAADQPWEEGAFVPYGPLSISPAAGVLNYGQGILEGLKAFRLQNGEIALFRPYDNAARFARGAQRLCIPPVPVEQFVAVMKELVRRNRQYVPPFGLGSLYLRPCLWGTGEVLGMAPAPEYSFVTYVSPVGNYFKSGEILPVKFEVCDTFHRSAMRGVGNVKFIGNYAPTLLPTMQAKQQGFAGSLYLDSVHEKYIEEAGVANFFCVKEGKFFTPQLSGSILAGIIRASVIQLAREVLSLEVIEMPLPLEMALQADECFCSGTATVVSPIGSITYRGRETIFNQFNCGPYTSRIYDLLTKIQSGINEDPFGWLVKVD